MSTSPLNARDAVIHVPERFLQLEGVHLWPVVVAEVTDLSPAMRRITLTGPDIDQLEYQSGQDLMVPFAIEGDRVITRRYTIRALDRASRRVSLDIALHGDGPGVRWARSAQPGDAVELAGPRGKVFLNPSASAHLFFGDESAIPMAFAMMEALPAHVPAQAFLEIDGPSDEVAWSPAGDQKVVWVHRAGNQADDGERMLAAFRGQAVPSASTHVYVAGEVMLVRAIQQKLAHLGFRPDQLSPKAYWGRGNANALNGEPEQRAL